MSAKLDIDQLRFFKILLEHRNLSTTASVIGISVPSASRMLASLRAALDDELFVRYSHGMTPSARALELAPIVDHLLEDYQRLFACEQFRPETLVRRFRIAAVDHATVSFLLRPLAEIQKVAPGVSVLVEPIGTDFEVKLRSGELDFAIFPVRQTAKELSTQPLCNDHFVYACRQGHPLLTLGKERLLTNDDLRRWPRTDIVVSTGADLSRNERLALTPAETTRAAAPSYRGELCTPYFLSSVLMALTSEAYAHLPIRLLEALRAFMPLVPFGVNERAQVFYPQLIWSTVRGSDPAHAWVRAMIVANQSKCALERLLQAVPLIRDVEKAV